MLRKISFNAKYVVKTYDKGLPVMSIKSVRGTSGVVAFGDDFVPKARKKYRKSPARAST